MITSRVSAVTYRFGHHSRCSGYDQLAAYTAETIVAAPLPKSIVRDRILWRLAKGVIAYDRTALATELKTAWSMINRQRWVYHILYGENTYHYTGYLNNLHKNRLLATFHQPPSVFTDYVQIDWHIRQLSAVICVGSNQLEFFSERVDNDRLFYVPHGVDTEYFTPPTNFHERRSDLCLCVGNWLRDFATLRGVIELIAYLRPEIQFVVVTQPDNYARLGKHPNLTICSGISDMKLLELYQSATLLIMPLIDATANNAILESMACGLPIVATDTGATSEYVAEDCSVLVPRFDSQRMAAIVLQLLDEPLEREKMGQHARERAHCFAWPKIVEQLDTIYTAVA